jgi:hypothetical protein
VRNQQALLEKAILRIISRLDARRGEEDIDTWQLVFEHRLQDRDDGLGGRPSP